MLLINIFLPLVSSCILGIFGRFLGVLGSIHIILICNGLLLLSSFFNIFSLLINNTFYFYLLSPWMITDTLYISWGFLLDSVSIIMLFIVSFISFIIHIYSIDYMKTDPHQIRFLSYLSLFTFFMILLITSDNFLQMFVGWEGVGVCSYLLINFWFTRIQANKAAIKAMLINRIGDFSLIFGIFTLYFSFNSLNYNVIFSLVPYLYTLNITFFSFSYNLINFITFFIFIGAMGKSAQLGLHSWLPDAMEGPTPVSALLHSATMVTAGVFLLIRISPLLEYATTTLIFISIIGTLTTFFSATIGLFQNDIKRIIAYSTCSQLGYMIFACGSSNYMTSFFHLFNHAFFKALLFLCSGAIIHALFDEQDIRKMGGLKKLLPFTYTSMLIASLALIGFPFLSGFYSKDLILESVASLYNSIGFFSFFLGSFAAFCTAFYSFRLLYLVFLTNFNGFRISLIHIHEISNFIFFAFCGLLVPSIFSGYLAKNLFVGMGSTFWQNSIFTSIKHFNLIEVEFLSISFKLIPLILTFCGLLSCFFIFQNSKYKTYTFKLTTYGLFFFNFFNRKWYFDKLYNLYVTPFISFIGYSRTYQNIDKGLIEFFGPFGITNFILSAAKYFNLYQVNNLYLYIFYLFFTLFTLLYLIWYSLFYYLCIYLFFLFMLEHFENLTK